MTVGVKAGGSEVDWIGEEVTKNAEELVRIVQIAACMGLEKGLFDGPASDPGVNGFCVRPWLLRFI